MAHEKGAIVTSGDILEFLTSQPNNPVFAEMTSERLGAILYDESKRKGTWLEKIPESRGQWRISVNKKAVAETTA